MGLHGVAPPGTVAIVAIVRVLRMMNERLKEAMVWGGLSYGSWKMEKEAVGMLLNKRMSIYRTIRPDKGDTFFSRARPTLAALRRDAGVAEQSYWNFRMESHRHRHNRLPPPSPTSICSPERVWWSCGGLSRNILTFASILLLNTCKIMRR